MWTDVENGKTNFIQSKFDFYVDRYYIWPFVMKNEYCLYDYLPQRFWMRNQTIKYHGYQCSALKLAPLFKVKQCWLNLKVTIHCQLFILWIRSVKSTYRKSCAGNVVLQSNFTLVPMFRVKLECADL